MTNEEFKDQLDKLRSIWGEDYDRIDPTPEEYKVIEYVYTWHPAIDNVYGKREIANLYYFGGMSVILNMVDTASEAEDLNDDYEHAYAKAIEAKREIERFRHNVAHNLPKFIK